MHRRDEIDVKGKGKGKAKARDQEGEEEHEEKEEAVEKGAIVSQSFTAEGIKEGEDNDLFNVPLKVEWLDLIYVLFRDQVRSSSLFLPYTFQVGRLTCKHFDERSFIL